MTRHLIASLIYAAIFPICIVVALGFIFALSVWASVRGEQIQ